MRKLIVSLGACALLLPFNSEAASWFTDLAAAQAKAKAENKLLLLNFTGSDWCRWCIALRDEVFTQPEFDVFANENLVLVELDFPQRKVLPPLLQKANAALANKYQITGFPSIIILASTGKPLAKTGYLAGGPKVFIENLQRIPGVTWRTPETPAPPPQLVETPPPPPPPLFNGAATAPPPYYKELQLKGISGPRNRRLAIINNQTLGEGEAGMVKLGNAQVKIKCLEIRDKSAIVILDGTRDQRELRLQGG